MHNDAILKALFKNAELPTSLQYYISKNEVLLPYLVFIKNLDNEILLKLLALEDSKRRISVALRSKKFTPSQLSLIFETENNLDNHVKEGILSNNSLTLTQIENIFDKKLLDELTLVKGLISSDYNNHFEPDLKVFENENFDTVTFFTWANKRSFEGISDELILKKVNCALGNYKEVLILNNLFLKRPHLIESVVNFKAQGYQIMHASSPAVGFSSKLTKEKFENIISQFNVIFDEDAASLMDFLSVVAGNVWFDPKLVLNEMNKLEPLIKQKIKDLEAVFSEKELQNFFIYELLKGSLASGEIRKIHCLLRIESNLFFQKSDVLTSEEIEQAGTICKTPEMQLWLLEQENLTLEALEKIASNNYILEAVTENAEEIYAKAFKKFGYDFELPTRINRLSGQILSKEQFDEFFESRELRNFSETKDFKTFGEHFFPKCVSWDESKWEIFFTLVMNHEGTLKELYEIVETI